MMSVCPLCNGLSSLSLTCPNCHHQLDDQGKLTDYFDDYSSYLDMNITKMVDGDSVSLQEDRCVHYFYCPQCHYEQVQAVKEIPIK